MKPIHFILALSASVLLCAVSCSKEKAVDAVDPVDEDIVSETKAIPLDDALKILDSFVAELDSGNLITKSAAARKIASVETHYSGLLTKSGEELPDAYIVNYENEEGFAVLGANSSVLPIVAYTEEGSFSAEMLADFYASLKEEPEPIEVDEDGSPLLYRPAAKAVVSAAIAMTIEDKFDNSDVDANKGGQTGTSPKADCVAPLVKTKWGQGEYGDPGVYNKYCKYAGRICYAGCSMIATAQVMAYNKCKDPSPIFDYSKMITTGKLTDDGLDPVKVDNTGRFIGSIFEHIVINGDKSGSSSSMANVRKYLWQMDGYYNVYRSNQRDFTNACVATAKGMIKEGKPVIVSGRPTVGCGHAWILDGYKYFNGELYFHCNWGYEGLYDGYFSANWFSPVADNAQFDSPDSQSYIDCKRLFGEELPGCYSWYFDLLTYDL